MELTTHYPKLAPYLTIRMSFKEAKQLHGQLKLTYSDEKLVVKLRRKLSVFK